ncbi:hypothetical protein [Sphingomonas sp. 2378]|uniref:hypothetical protein n=1 Tax=Sphingomonas sp. 2378 TaxID=1219748 RepID=UPI00311AC50B
MSQTITIAGATMALAAAPVDLDAQLVAATGCDSREIERLLSSGADRCAAALAPFLVEPVEHVALANLVAADPSAIGTIRALYAALPDHAPDAVARVAATAPEEE